jgi:hypothetical protein
MEKRQALKPQLVNASREVEDRKSAFNDLKQQEADALEKYLLVISE